MAAPHVVPEGVPNLAALRAVRSLEAGCVNQRGE
jgi:hypothetical protein